MLTTRTGSFPIGFRRGWSDWQRNLDGLIAWAKENQLGVVDLGNDADTLAEQVLAAGLQIGSVDLPNWQGLITEDVAEREAAVAQQVAYVEKLAPLGVKNYFLVMLPKDTSKSRAENFALMVEGLNLLVPTLEKHGARLVIEGWPGNGALACTPESYSATFTAVPSKSVGINYDPSHLLRMGIDPVRFLAEFVDRVYHVHGKDTERFPEAQYEFGTEIGATLAKGHGFGSLAWRYTIPGHGETRWGRVFEILKEAGYSGAVCIELEDENFNGTEEGDKLGIVLGAQFLAGC